MSAKSVYLSLTVTENGDDCYLSVGGRKDCVGEDCYLKVGGRKGRIVTSMLGVGRIVWIELCLDTWNSEEWK